MTGRVERADGERNAAFPEAWGTPRGAPSSDERRDWVAAQVRRHVLDRKLTSDPDLRAAYMARRRQVGP
ncbi:MAG: hypothetical protein ABI807_05525 [Sporichthyaceae bacterium]